MGKSSQLRLSDIRRVFRLLNEVREAGQDPRQARSRMVDGLCRLVGARQGTLFAWEGFSPTGRLKLLDAVHGGWASPEAGVVWAEMMRADDWHGDPILNRAVQISGQVRTYLHEQLVSRPEWEASEVRNVVAKRVGIDECLIAWYRRDRAGAVDGVSLQRAWADHSFGPRDRNVLHLFNVELYRLTESGEVDFSRPEPPRLTPRQRQVLDRLLAGDGEKQIGRRLGISVYTVNDHVKAIHRTLGVNSRGELMAKFVRPPALNPSPSRSG